MSFLHRLTLLVAFYLLGTANPVSLLDTPYAVTDNSDSDVFQILNNKDYLPNEDVLPKSSFLKNVGDDATYIISKLSDEELVKLLNQQPKTNEYNLNDFLKITSNAKEANAFDTYHKPRKQAFQKAFFKLDDKEVEPFSYNNNGDLKYNAVQKLNNILYSHQQTRNSDENDEKNEMLFDVLVAQLKALCCKKNKSKQDKNLFRLKALLKKVKSQKKQTKSLHPEKTKLDQKMIKSNEHIFLIVNDEIKSNGSEELIAVDPESLSKNSTVLLLGPITTPLSDVQLKIVMTRIANELSKTEYLPLLQKISEGALDDSNVGLMNSLLTGSDSRRYIKPHRCNHQSRLAKIYGGPKWLICTGYININTPSLYD